MGNTLTLILFDNCFIRLLDWIENLDIPNNANVKIIFEKLEIAEKGKETRWNTPASIYTHLWNTINKAYMYSI